MGVLTSDYYTLQVVLLFNLLTFATAFVTLLFFIRIPQVIKKSDTESESVLQSAKSGLQHLKSNRGNLNLILLLTDINFTVSFFNAALPAMLLSQAGGEEMALGMLHAVTEIATMLGSVLATGFPVPKCRDSYRSRMLSYPAWCSAMPFLLPGMFGTFTL